MSASIAVRRGLLAAAAAMTCLLFASSARANNLLVADANDCGNPDLSQPFLPWLDAAHYFSLGTFEDNAAGWSLSSGAGVTSGNEPWQVAGSSDSQSLDLPRGSSATSPTVCVGIDDPAVRFFAKRSGGGLLGKLSVLEVDAIVQTNVLGATVTVPVGVTGTGNGWSPTLPMVVAADLLPLLPGNQTPVAFKFTPIGTADWQIDDTYVDPMHCC